MSYTIEDKEILISEFKNPNVHYFVDNQLDQPYNIFKDTDLVDSAGCFILDWDIGGGGELEFKYKKIKNSDGPILGFLGWYLDIETGYLLMSEQKSRDYIPFFDFYKWLELRGIYVTKELIVSVLERFKLGILKFEDLIYELNSYSLKKGSDKSLVSKFVLAEGVEIEGKIEKFDFISLFKGISQFFENFRISKNIGANGTSQSQGEFYEGFFEVGLDDYFMNVRNIANGIADVNLKILAHSGGNLNKKEIYSLCSMVHTKSDMRYISKIKNVSKTTALALNLYDISEELEMEGDLEYSVIEGDKQARDEVMEKIGVNEYLSGTNKANMSRGLKRDDTKRNIEKGYEAINKISTIGYLDNVVRQGGKLSFQRDFVRKVARLRKVFRRVDRVLR